MGKFYFAILFLIFLSGCSEQNPGKQTNSNTYYIELLNFNDSLKSYIESKTSGKVIFSKDNKLEMVSSNYITKVYPDMHYLESIADLQENKTEYKTKKVQIELIDSFSVDSIKYSLKKFSFGNNQWNMISDMGTLKIFPTYKKSIPASVREFGAEIVKNVASYVYE